MNRPAKRGAMIDRLVSSVVAHPHRVLLITAAIIAIAGTALIDLPISTSREALISEDVAFQSRLVRFTEQFGHEDFPVFVVRGGSAQSRREAVDELLRALSQDPRFERRVLGRIGMDEMAPLLPFFAPNLIASVDADVSTRPLFALLKESRVQIESASFGLDQQLAFGDSGVLAAQLIAVQLDPLLGVLESLERSVREPDARFDPLAALGTNRTASTAFSVDASGYLVGGPSMHLVATFPDLPDDHVETVRPIVEALRRLRDTVDHAPDVHIELTGLPTLYVDEQDVIESGVLRTSLGTGIGVFLLLLIAFRSPKRALISLGPLVAGIVLTLASARLLFGGLNMITSGLTAMLLGLGIDFSVHAMSRFNERLAIDESPAEAMRVALTRSGPAVLTAAITTALAFAATTVSEFTAFAELGVLATLGMGFILLATFVLLPALASASHTNASSVAPPTVLRTLASAIEARSAAILIVAVALAVAAAMFAFPMRFNSRVLDFLPQQTESARGLRALEASGVLTPTFASVSGTGVEETRRMTASLRALDTVGEAQSGTDLLPRLTAAQLSSLAKVEAPETGFDLGRCRRQGEALRAESVLTREALDDLATRVGASAPRIAEAARALDRLSGALRNTAELERFCLTEQKAAGWVHSALVAAKRVGARGRYLPEDLPLPFSARFVSRDGRRMASFAYPSIDAWDEAQAKRFAAEIESVDPESAGFGLSIHRYTDMIVSGAAKAAVIALLGVLAVLLWDFRSARLALLALGPVLLGFLWMLGVMGLMGWSFDSANIVALPLLLGIGIDSGIHLVHRSQEGDGRISTMELVSRTGAAILFSSLTTMAGFAGLTLADYGGMKSLGAVMVTGIACNLIASLVVLPALMARRRAQA